MADFLEQRLALLANTIDDSDWLDVRRRARHYRRAGAVRIAFVAVALAAVVVATPAFGVGGRLLDLVTGSPAPPEVRTYFASNKELRKKMLADAGDGAAALAARFPAVVPAQARGIFAIDSQDGPIYLWAAPTEDGRQCWVIQEGADPRDRRVYGVGTCDDSEAHGALAIEGPNWSIERPNVETVHVRVYDPSIVSVEIEVEGAEPVSVPVASGHVLAVLPKDAVISAFVGRDADGNAVAREKALQA